MLITQSDRAFYNKNKDQYTHIVSIVTPNDDSITKLHEHHLIVKCYDVDKVMENKFRKYTPPEMKDIGDALTIPQLWWLKSLEKEEDFRLLVHCDMGVSRSPAITLAILWSMSAPIFNLKPSTLILRPWLEARKDWCANAVDEVNSTALKRFILGRYNPGVKPNQAILQICRNFIGLEYFPW